MSKLNRLSKIVQFKTNLDKIDYYEDLKELLERTRSSGPMYLVVVLLMYTFTDMLDHASDSIYAAVFAIIFVSLWRIQLLFQKNIEPSKKWYFIFDSTSLVAALSWGVLSADRLIHGGVTSSVVISCLIIIALAAGATSSLFIRIRMLWLYQVLILGPTVIGGIQLQTREGLVIAILAFVYIIYLAFQANKAYRDYQEKKALQKQIIKNFDRLQKTVMEMPVATVTIHDGRLTFNKLAENLIGFKKEEIQNIDQWFEKIYPNSTTEVRKIYENVKSYGVKKSEVFPVYRKSGEKRLVRFSAWSENDLEVWIMHDETELIHYREQLESNARALEAAQEISLIGSYEYDLRSNTLICSEQAKMNLGFDDINKLQMEWHQIIHPDDIALFKKNWEDSIKNNKKHEFSYRIKRQGAEVYINTIGMPLVDQHGNVIKMYGTLQDITEQRLQDFKVRQAELEMFNATRMQNLSEMAGGVAHEINNPLAILVGKIHVLLVKVEKNQFSQADYSQYLLSMESTVMRIKRIVQLLHDFTNPKRELNQFESTSSLRLITDTLELMKQKLSIKGIDVRYSLDAEEQMIDCHRSQISQVIYNLINNSLEAVKDLPTKEKWIEMKTSYSQGYFYFTISDNGMGIPDAIKDKIMEPFFTTKVAGKSPGMGLAIAKSIIEAHHGELHFMGNHPHTSFQFRIPIKNEQQIKKIAA